MKAPLAEAVKSALVNGNLTYREITDVINRHRLYLPKAGTLVANAQVRASIRKGLDTFVIDRGTMPHRIAVKRRP